MVVRNKAQFAFDPGVTAKNLYAENRTEGAVSLRRSRAINVAISIDAKELMDNIIGNLTAMNQTDNPEERATLKSSIVGAMRELGGSAKGQAALAGLVSGRPELLGLLNSILGVSGTDKGDASSAKGSDTSDDAGASDSPDSANSGSGNAAATGSASDPPAKSENAAAKAVGDFSEALGTFDSSKLASINPRRRRTDIRLTSSS